MCPTFPFLTWSPSFTFLKPHRPPLSFSNKPGTLPPHCFLMHYPLCLKCSSSLSYPWASTVAQTVKASVCNAGDPGSSPRSGRSPGEGNGNPLQYSCLENPMDRGACRLQSMGSQRVGLDWATLLYLQLSIWLAISSPSVLYSSHHLTDVFSSHKKVCTVPLHSQIFHLPLLFLLRSTIYCNCIQTATYNIFYISAFAVYNLFPY